MRKLQFSHRFGRRWWNIEVVDRLGEQKLGDCDADPTMTPRILRLTRSQSTETRWRVAIHEALHAIFPEFNEETVERTEDEIYLFLEKLERKGNLKITALQSQRVKKVSKGRRKDG